MEVAVSIFVSAFLSQFSPIQPGITPKLTSCQDKHRVDDTDNLQHCGGVYRTHLLSFRSKVNIPKTLPKFIECEEDDFSRSRERERRKNPNWTDFKKKNKNRLVRK